MPTLFFSMLAALLALVVVTPLHAQQSADASLRCYEHQDFHITGIKRLHDGTQTTLKFSEGQTVAFSSDAVGQTLSSQDDVELQFMPSGERYRFSGENSTAPDMAGLLVAGENQVRVTAPPGAVYWLVTASPCPVPAVANGSGQQATLSAAPAATANAAYNAEFQQPVLDPGYAPPRKAPVEEAGAGGFIVMVRDLQPMAAMAIRLLAIGLVAGLLLALLAAAVAGFFFRDRVLALLMPYLARHEISASP